MKRKLLHALLLATAVIGLSSCSDDDEGPSNYFSYDGKTKGVTGNGNVYFDETGGNVNGQDVYFHEVTFVSGDINNLTSISGLTMTLSSNTKAIPAGTYTFTGTDETGKGFEITDGTVYIDVNMENATMDGMYEIVSGSAKVAVSGDTYTIDLTGTASKDGEAAGAKEVKAHYSGKLEDFQ